MKFLTAGSFIFTQKILMRFAFKHLDYELKILLEYSR